MARSQHELEEAWKELLAGKMTAMHKARMGLRSIPSAPRCKLCLAPFGKPGGAFFRLVGRGRWEGNPALCRICIAKLAKIPGGAEVEVSVLFADVRGSTGVAERMSPADFRGLLNRFYQAAAQSVDKELGVVDKFLGDGVLALFIPGFGGPDHAHQAIQAGTEILRVTGNASGNEHPWLPIGAGIHTGIAFVGCQLHHLGYSISGVMHVVTEDGQAIDIPPASVYEIPPGHDAWVVGDQPWVTVEWTSARTFGLVPDGPGEGVLVTVLFTDIVDSTATLQRMGDTAWRDLLIIHNTRLRDQLNTFRGREVKTTGDGFLAVFDSATRAVRCGAAMARSAHTIGLPIRVGLHTGEVEFVGNDARGLAVHAAARVMSVGGPDEVLVSSTTYDLLEGSGLQLEEAGIHEMKGLPGARRVFRLAPAAP